MARQPLRVSYPVVAIAGKDARTDLRLRCEHRDKHLGKGQREHPQQQF